VKPYAPYIGKGRLAGRRLIHRLIFIEAICFALLILFISIDDEWLIPKLISKDFPFTTTALAGAIDSIWVAALFALALYIQIKYLQKIRLLEGMLSVCANCKKIRDGEDHWSPMEEYIRQRSHADFSHTICPDCGVKLYGDLYLQAMRNAENLE
jgi:hypothetical protein